jgi:hypothetical protein
MRLVTAAAVEVGLQNAPIIALSLTTTTPFVCGILRSVLVLPEDALNWSDQRLRFVILHELAHIKRKDNLTWPLINLIISWLWFLPLVWIVLAKLKREGEKACDDIVLDYSCSPFDYAEHLINIATLMKQIRFSTSAIAMADRYDLKSRIGHILNARAARSKLSRLALVVLSALMIAITVPIASVTILGNTVNVPETSDLIEDISNSEDVGKKARAAWWLGEHEATEAVLPLIDALNDPSPKVRMVSAWALGEIKDIRAIDQLLNAINDTDQYVCEMVVLALGEIENESASNKLKEVFNSQPNLRAQVIWALGEIRGENPKTVLSELSSNWRPIYPITNDLWAGELIDLEYAEIDSAEPEEIVQKLHSDDPDERRLAALELGLCGQRGAYKSRSSLVTCVNALIERLRDSDARVRAQTIWSLDEINPSKSGIFTEN